MTIYNDYPITMNRMTEPNVIRSKVLPGFQVTVPAELRKRFEVGVSDEVTWIIDGDQVKVDFKKRPSLQNIAALGTSGDRAANAVESKKRTQRGET